MRALFCWFSRKFSFNLVYVCHFKNNRWKQFQISKDLILYRIMPNSNKNGNHWVKTKWRLEGKQHVYKLVSIYIFLHFGMLKHILEHCCVFKTLPEKLWVKYKITTKIFLTLENLEAHMWTFVTIKAFYSYVVK